MSSFTLQMLCNSGLFVFWTVRYADYFWTPEGRRPFVLFLATTFVINFWLLLDRFDAGPSFYKAVAMTAGYVVGTWALAWWHRRSARKEP